MDRRIVMPAATQVLALIMPFVYLRTVVAGHGSEMAVASELVLSLMAYFAILIDWSATTFLARLQARLLDAGAYWSLLVGRILMALLLLSGTALVLHHVQLEAVLQSLAICALMLLGIVVDPSWIHVGRGAIWAPSALGAVRFGCATVLSIFDIDPVFSLALSYFLGSLLFLVPVWSDISKPSRVSLSMPWKIVRRYVKPTVADLLTAAFSRLDVAIAASILPVDQALIYAVCRKMVVGLQSVAFSSARHFYLERNPAKLEQMRRSLKMGSFLIAVVGTPVAYFTAVYGLLAPQGFTLTATLCLLMLLLPLGYFKTVIQFSNLYQARSYGTDLLYTALSMASFLSVVGCISFTGVLSAVFLALARISSDITYVGLAMTSQWKRHVLS